VTLTGVTEQPSSGLPREFALDQNYPNPFNPTTTISYALPTQATVRLKIINMLGQEVTTLVDAPQPGGYYNVTWTGHSDKGFAVASGVYAYRLEAKTADGKNINILKKMVLLK
jgi:flagellar hook assembly protein FlgD